MSESGGAGGLGLLGKRLNQALETLRGWGAAAWMEAGEGWFSSLLPVRLQEVLARRGWGPPTRVLGLDVDGSQVFAVELCRRRNAVVVERAAQFALPAPSQRADAAAGARQPDAGARPTQRGPTDARRDTAGQQRSETELDTQQCAGVVQELVRRGFSARQMATVVSRERTFERTFQLPAGTPAELEAMAALRSEHELPLAAEEVCVDFLFVGSPRPTQRGGGAASWPPAAEGADGHLMVVCAASKAVVERQTAPWVEAGLEPLALEVVGLSAFRALRPLRQQRGGEPAGGAGPAQRTPEVSAWPPRAAEATGGAEAKGAGLLSEPPQTSPGEPRTEAGAARLPTGRVEAAASPVCLLLVRERGTELVIGRETPQFSRALQPGGLAWAGEGPSSPAAGEGRSGAEPPEARLAREVTRTLQAFAGEFPDEAVDRVVLVSRYAVNREVLERAVGLPVEVPGGLPGVALGVDTGPAGELGATFAAAVGAAWPEVAWRPGLPIRLERVNLLTRRQARWERERRYHRVRVAMVAAVLALVGMFLPVSLAALRLLTLFRLDRQLKAMAPQVKELEAMEQRLTLLRPWTVERALPLDIFTELTRVATAEVYVKSVFVNDTGRLSLEGLATGYEGAYALVRGLTEKHGLLSDVTLVGGRRGSTAEAGGDPRFTYEFTVTAQVPRWSAQGQPRGAGSPLAQKTEEPR